MPLPASAYDACQKWAIRVSSLALVRFYGNDYSVPARYAHRELLVRGYVEQVEFDALLPRLPSQVLRDGAESFAAARVRSWLRFSSGGLLCVGWTRL